MPDIPVPLTYHPWYEEYKDPIVDWLEGNRPPYDGGPLLLPVFPPFRIQQENIEVITFAQPHILRLDRKRYWGPAPYVGWPYHYEWWVAEDQYKRHVVSEARRVPMGPDEFVAKFGIWVY